jgi:hypothetical protein
MILLVMSSKLKTCDCSWWKVSANKPKPQSIEFNEIKLNNIFYYKTLVVKALKMGT